MTHDDGVFKAGFVKQQRRFRVKRIEPASRLVDSLRQESSRKLFFKQFFVFKRVMDLGKRHRTGIKPAVDDFGRALTVPAAFRAPDDVAVDIGAMQLDGQRAAVARKRRQLFPAGYGNMVSAGRTFPDVQGCAPVTVAGNAPVLDVFKPVTESSLADRLRHPVDHLVVAHQIVTHGGHFDEPRFARVVQQRCRTAPAMRVIVLEFRRVKQHAFFVEIFQDLGVGAPDALCLLVGVRLRTHAGKRGFVLHKALFVHHLHKRDVILAAHARVVFTEGRRAVNDAGTVRHRNVVIAHHEKRFFALALCGRFRGAFVKRLVFPVFQIRSLHFFQDLIRVLRVFAFSRELREYAFEQCLCHIIDIAVLCLHLRVCLIRIDAERDIG